MKVHRRTGVNGYKSEPHQVPNGIRGILSG